MKRLFTLLFVVLLSFTAFEAAAQEIVDVSKSDYRIYTSDGQPATLEDIRAAMQAADVVFVGELHNDPVSHHIEQVVLKQWHELYGSAAALSLEMFGRDVQYIVDEYLSDKITDSHFQLSSSPWSNYETDYRPLVEYAKTNGLHVIAANAPRRYSNMVTRMGRESLLSLTDQARSYMAPLPYGEPSAEYKAQWDQVMADAMAEMMAASEEEEEEEHAHDMGEGHSMDHGEGMDHEMGEGHTCTMMEGDGEHECKMMEMGEGHSMDHGEGMNHEMDHGEGMDHAAMHAKHHPEGGEMEHGEGMDHGDGMNHEMEHGEGEGEGHDMGEGHTCKMMEGDGEHECKMMEMGEGHSMDHGEEMEHGEGMDHGEGHEMEEKAEHEMDHGEGGEHSEESEEHKMNHAKHMAEGAHAEEGEHEMNHEEGHDAGEGHSMEHGDEMDHDMEHEVETETPVMGGQSQHGGGSMLDAQALWDATMAWSIAEHMNESEGAKVAHFVGGFHVETGTGTPEHLAAYLPNTRMLVISVQTAEDINNFDPSEHKGLGDFVILGDESLPRTYETRTR